MSKRVVVFKGDADYMLAVGWHRFLGEMIEKIPEEYRDKAVLEFEVKHGYYDSHEITVELVYFRPKTKEERKKEQAEEDRRKEERERAEREEYLRLKKKFGES